MLFMVYLLLGSLFSQQSWSQSEEKKVPAAIKPTDTAKCIIGKKVKAYPFYVYKDGNSAEDHFFASGLMGDFADLSVDLYNKENPYSGSSCVKIAYKPAAVQGTGWAGLYWQYPANNWGDIPTGYDLRRATKLTFWARGEKGGEVINTFQMGGISGKYGDTGAKAIGPITLSKDWKQYAIDLHYVDGSIIFTKENWQCWPFMEPLSRIIGGFCWATSLDVSGKNPIVFYLDEIRFENQ